MILYSTIARCRCCGLELVRFTHYDPLGWMDPPREIWPRWTEHLTQYPDHASKGWSFDPSEEV